MRKPPPPPNKAASEAVTGDSRQAPASPTGKKPWSKPGLRLIEDGTLATESSPDPDYMEDHSYYITSN